jgi:hypothetical protein
MKKLIVIVLAFLHLSASAGVSMHMHYCMGKLADWTLSQKESRVCGTCGMEKSGKNDCCKDEYKFVKNTGDQKAAESAFQLIELASVALPASIFETLTIDLPSVTEAYPISHAPPDSRPAAYIRNCVFRI